MSEKTVFGKGFGWWKKIQAISGLAFGSFLGLHLVNHGAVLFGGKSLGNSVLNLFRMFYQNPVIEPLLGFSVLTHIVCNSVLFLEFPKSDTRTETKLQKLTGLILTLLIPGHVFAVRISPWLVNFPSDVSLAALAQHIYFPFFHFYYFILFSSGLYHSLVGFSRALSHLGFSAPRPSWWLLSLVPLLSAGIVQAYFVMPITNPQGLFDMFSEHTPEFLLAIAKPRFDALQK